MLQNITLDDAEEREDLEAQLDEMEDAETDGADVTRASDRFKRRLARLAAASESGGKNKGGPNPPGKRKPASKDQDEDEGEGKPKHSASKSWFGA